MKTSIQSRLSDPSPHFTAASVRHGDFPSRRIRRWLATAVIAALPSVASAQVPQLINYQGRVAVGTPAVNFDGSGQFKFALVNADATTSYWSNDGTSTAGSQPTNAVALTVSKGLYSVLLGDATLPGMTIVPATVFANSDVRLRIWFSDGDPPSGHGFQLLTPDQRIAAVGYAMMAGNVQDGTVTTPKLAAGAVTSANIAAGAVGTAQMADFAVTGNKLRLGTEADTVANGVLAVGPSVLTFTRTFAYPFAVAPAVSLLTPGWTLGPVSASGFSATIAFTPQTLDSAGSVGSYTSLALVDGFPAIAYYDQTNGALKYLRASDAAGTTWGTPLTIDTTNDTGRYPSLVVVDGHPAISYYDVTFNDLMFVRASDAAGTAWGTPVRIDSSGDVGTYNSMAVVDGFPAISYFGNTAGVLKYVRATDAGGTAWSAPVTVDSTGRVGIFTTLRVVNGRPAIGYYDTDNDVLKYVRANDATGTAWGTPVTVDNAARAGTYASLAVVDGHPAISYFEGIPNMNLRYVRATDPDGTAWATPLIIDSTGDVGRYSSLAVVDGRPAISYSDTANGDLKYVHATDAAGAIWGAPATIDNQGIVGTATSLAVIDGRPAISYYDVINTDLKFAMIPEELRWQASDGSVAPLTAATVTAGAIGSEQLAADAVQAGNIASGAIGSTQLAPNAVQSSNIAAGAVGGTQLDPSIGLWTASGANVSRGTGYVGIGTTSPADTLHVAGVIRADQFRGPLVVNGGNLTYAADGGDHIFTTATLERMRVTVGGNIGIGTPSPTAKLDVAGTVKAASFTGDGAGLTHIPASAVVTAPPGMMLIPAGAFTMGNSVAADTDITNAAPVSVTLSAFYLAVNEVTLSQWQAVYYWATSPSHGYSFTQAGAGKSANHPVQTVDWYDCVKWCNARSEMEGLTPCYTVSGATYKTGSSAPVCNWTANGYRLPSEAEWEKAARGGLSGQRFPWGDTITQNLANYYGNTASYAYDLGPDGYNPIGSVGGTSPATSPVGSFAANGYGINDMSGNVLEWCWDWYGTPYAGGSNPHGPVSGSYRVLRGGDWHYYAVSCRVAYRCDCVPTGSNDSFGFRVARSSVP